MKVENTDEESGSEEEKEPDFVRAHHMFSRILNFLFVIVYSRKKASFLYKNGILLPKLF